MELKLITKSENKLRVLNDMGIVDVKDLLQHYPFRYDNNMVVPFVEWQEGDKVFFEARVASGLKTSYYAAKKCVTHFDVVYDEEVLKITIFNRPYLKGNEDDVVTITGTYNGHGKVSAISLNFKPMDNQVGLIPVYNLKEGITQNEMRKYIKKAIGLMESKIHDVIPASYIAKYHMMSKEEAIKEVHFPSDKKQLEYALHYLKYEEFLKFNVTMQLAKKQTKEIAHKSPRVFDETKLMEVIQKLNFELSDDQKTVLKEILNDMRSDKVMYRLLQGDVGSGKTIVAIIALYAAALSGVQAVMMAPTEILAKQHYDNIRKLLPNVHAVILSGSMKKSEKEDLYQDIREGKAKIIIGTHALFQEGVIYQKLGLVITDEQHRFGVEQRRRLKDKGEAVDVLLMSATPIPRTLALSLYGDMDVSTIKTLPSGRKQVKTVLLERNSFVDRYDEIVSLLEQGNQMYVITAMIEENEDFKIKHAQGIYEALKQNFALFANVGLLHGKMSSEEKELVMQEFARNEIQVLVSTTVVEVGVNVPNANIMVIYDADRFGLSQLHQLRGRIGRGDKQGYCYLLTGNKSADSLKRLKVLTKTTDGFEIAREDLLLRGAGDILGTRQSGVSGFVLGDVILDTSILDLARSDAEEIITNFDKEENKMLRLWLDIYQKNNISYVD